MSLGHAAHPTVPPDAVTAAMMRFAARIAVADEAAMREGAAECIAAAAPVAWVEELLLQSYLICGFPRTLNAMREWRRVSGTHAPAADAVGAPDLARWRAEGERTCATVYGRFYDKLRHNMAELHPALDEWMVVEGYGKILSRPGLPLRMRELCIVAACAAAQQERQLHSHLHGSLHAGVTPEELRGALQALRGVVDPDAHERAVLLLERVLGKH